MLTLNRLNPCNRPTITPSSQNKERIRGDRMPPARPSHTPLPTGGSWAACCPPVGWTTSPSRSSPSTLPSQHSPSPPPLLAAIPGSCPPLWSLPTSSLNAGPAALGSLTEVPSLPSLCSHRYSGASSSRESLWLGNPQVENC